MRLHLVSLPHTQTTVEYLTCAYTQKVRKFGKMMTAAGHDVVIYSGEQNDTVCAEHVPLLTERQRRRWFGRNDQSAIHPITWGPDEPHWQTMNSRAIREISKRRGSRRDLLLLSAGCCQQQIADAIPDMTACEPFVGYEGISTPFRAFESSAWMHHVYGRQGIGDGVWYDDVIPNFFDPDEFRRHKHDPGGKYLLFLGRVTLRKGPHVAAAIAEAYGLPLKIAGPGVNPGASTPGSLVGDYVTVDGGHVDYVGAVGVAERARLLAGARALVAPTLFLEPFGGVAVEAMLTGTPVVASDWGAFRETVTEGVSGYRFRTLREAVTAVEACGSLDPAGVRAYALERYGLRAVEPMFTRWLRRLAGLMDDGWAALPPPAAEIREVYPPVKAVGLQA